MKIKKNGYLCVGIMLIVLLASFLLINNIKLPKTDTVNINDFAKTIEEGASKDEIESLKNEYNLNYYYVDDELIIYSDTEETFSTVKNYAMYTILFVVIVAIVFLMVYIFYVNRYIIGPFNKLKDFAGSVAKGNLDTPLLMDKQNIFGAFTESFDIMREELSIAKENERKANESKKELVASLSHDIKTPLASIKAITELLLVQNKDEDIMNRLHSIDRKTEQIEVLVNNLFHATLEELEELKVQLEPVSSQIIGSLLKNADSSNRLEHFEIPECLIECDQLRIQQVFDNIISNSYKYADSAIEVDSFIEFGYLVLGIEDYGEGVTEEDLTVIKQKYFRGSNSKGKNGAGIGLYISDYFMEKMNGYMRINNGEHGFKVTLGIKLA